MKNRQYNGQKKKDKGTNNDVQNTTQKTKDQATWTQLKTHVLRKGTLTRGVQSVIFVLRHHGFFGFYLQ